MSDFSYEITKKIGVLSTSNKGWTKEVNMISWCGKPAKIDIREWSPADENGERKMSKGITLSDEEATILKGLL